MDFACIEAHSADLLKQRDYKEWLVLERRGYCLQYNTNDKDPKWRTLYNADLVRRLVYVSTDNVVLYHSALSKEILLLLLRDTIKLLRDKCHRYLIVSMDMTPF